MAAYGSSIWWCLLHGLLFHPRVWCHLLLTCLELAIVSKHSHLSLFPLFINISNLIYYSHPPTFLPLSIPMPLTSVSLSPSHTCTVCVYSCAHLLLWDMHVHVVSWLLLCHYMYVCMYVLYTLPCMYTLHIMYSWSSIFCTCTCMCTCTCTCKHTVPRWIIFLLSHWTILV